MHTTLSSTDPMKLETGIALIHGMSLTALAARRNTSLSKENRDFFRRQEEALVEVVRFVREHQTDGKADYVHG